MDLIIKPFEGIGQIKLDTKPVFRDVPFSNDEFGRKYDDALSEMLDYIGALDESSYTPSGLY